MDDLNLDDDEDALTVSYMLGYERGKASALRAAAEREKDLTRALSECQKVLAMMTLPEAIQNSSVQHAWASAVAAETTARSILSKHKTETE